MRSRRLKQSLAAAVPKQTSHWLYLMAYVIVFLLGLLLVLVHKENTVWVAVGTSLVAAGIAGWVLFLHVWLSQSRMERLELLRQVGFVKAFNIRSVGIKDEYETRLTRVSDKIDIMGFGLRALREDYADRFPSWAAGAEVRILMLDPRFPKEDMSFARQRDLEEGDEIGAIGRDVETFVRKVSPLIQDPNLRFDVRLYRCLPTINMFRIDDELFWGPYLARSVSRNLPTFLIGSGGSLFPVLMRHFDTVWSDDELSQAPPAEWLA